MTNYTLHNIKGKKAKIISAKIKRLYDAAVIEFKKRKPMNLRRAIALILWAESEPK